MMCCVAPTYSILNFGAMPTNLTFQRLFERFGLTLFRAAVRVFLRDGSAELSRATSFAGRA